MSYVYLDGTDSAISTSGSPYVGGATTVTMAARYLPDDDANADGLLGTASTQYFFQTLGTGSVLQAKVIRSGPVNVQFNSNALAPAVEVPTWVRVDVDLDAGEGKFWYSTDDTNDYASVSTWTQVGTTVSIPSGTTTHDRSTNDLVVGDISTSATQPLGGRIYAAVVLIDGTVEFDADFTDLTPGEVAAGSFTEDSSNASTVTLSGSSWTFVGGKADLQLLVLGLL